MKTRAGVSKAPGDQSPSANPIPNPVSHMP